MRRLSFVLVCLAAACGPVEFDFLRYEQSQNRHTWSCPDGNNLVYEMPGSSVIGSEYQISLACTGLSLRCPNFSEGEFEPGSPECRDGARNVFVGTCVEDFVLPFDPFGNCTEHSGGISWSSGARIDGSRENGIAYSSTEEVAFIVERHGTLGYVYSNPR